MSAGGEGGGGGGETLSASVSEAPSNWIGGEKAN